MKETRRRILIIDDDPDIGLMLKVMLEYKGYTVTVSDRAEKAEEIVQENNPDIIIMDMLLSGINGTDICTKLKKNATITAIPILMISAHPNAKAACLQAGANDFVSKPFDMQDMLTRIGSLIDNPQ